MDGGFVFNRAVVLGLPSRPDLRASPINYVCPAQFVSNIPRTSRARQCVSFYEFLQDLWLVVAEVLAKQH